MIPMIAYIDPNYDNEYEIDELIKMDETDFILYARRCDEIHFYNLGDFQEAFNSEWISDQGYIRFIHV